MAGCQKPEQKEAVPATAVETDKRILKTLQDRYEKAVPLKANGQCLLLFYADGKPQKENFPVQLWVNPPSEIYMQGDVAFNAKGIVLGSNQGAILACTCSRRKSAATGGACGRSKVRSGR